MKKFLSLFAAVLFAGSMIAETVTLTMEDFAAASFTDQTSGISVATAKNAGSTEPVYNATGKDLRVYAKGSITISAEQNITGISFTISTQGKKRLAPLTADEGEVVVTGDPDFTAVWTGSAKSVTLTVGEKADYGTEGNTKAGQLDFTAIVVTLEGEGGGGEVPTVATPVISGEQSFEESVEVTITCATEGAVIFYTLDGTEPSEESNVYEAPITLTETTTVKAKAGASLSEGGVEYSAVATKTFTKVEPLPTEIGEVTTCAEAAEALAGVEADVQVNDGADFTLRGYVTEIATAYSEQYGNISFWMADTKDGGKVLEAFRCKPESADELPEVGDLVEVTGKLKRHGSTPEFDANCTCKIIEKGEGGEVPPVEGDVLTCAEAVEIAANNDGQEYTAQGYVTEIVTAYSSQYGNISFWMADAKDGGQVLQAFRCKPESADKLPEVGDKVQVTGKLKIYTKDEVSTPEFDANCTCKIIEKGEGGGSGEEGDVLTCAEAVEIAANNDGQEYTAQGYVTEIVTAYSSQYGNISFWMADAKDGGQVLQAFRCKPESADKLPEVGDKVQVTGKLKIYTKDDVSTPEFDANCTCKIIEKGEGGGGGEIVDPTNCAEAREAALSVSGDNVEYNDGKEYTIEGFVTSIQTAYNDQYHNVSFWMADTEDGGKVLQAYRAACASAADAPNVGDKVAVTGKLTKYGTTPEFAAGCTFTILEHAVAPVNLGEKTIEEFLALKNMKDTCVLTGVVKNIVMDKEDPTVPNKYGNFDLEDETGSVYVYGLLTAAGEAQKFVEMGIEEYDILTIKAVYNEYNGTPQAPNAVFVSVEKGEKPDPQTIELDVVYGEAALYATQGIWQLNLYKDWDSETQTVTYPDLYIGVTPKSETTIAGIYSIEEEIAFVEVDVASEQTVTATEATDLEVVCLGDGVYSFYMEFVGDDGNTYVLDAEVPVLAYNGESEEAEEIELEDDPETGVETTKVADKAVKFIENATLIIERNGVRYNVMGQVVR